MDRMNPAAIQQFEALWDRYNRQLLAFIRSRVSDDFEAEDLLQDVFVRIHLNLCCLRNLSKLESWIYQITRNAITDHYRLRKDLLELPETLSVEDEYPIEDLEAEIASSLKELVLELPPSYREALLLTEYGGLNQKELAEKQGISLSGAKSRVQRARQMLRDMLLACCHFELDHGGRIIDYQERCCCCAPVE
jgi:RNA polymerase sigma-70 factor (ECF subfamily)